MFNIFDEQILIFAHCNFRKKIEKKPACFNIMIKKVQKMEYKF